jgi:hypothetical protein
MAKKKTTRKSGRSAGKAPTRTAKKAARGGARKPAKPAKRSAAKASRGPVPIKTGRGATPREIGEAVVQHFNRGGPDKELWGKYWHPQAESIEGEGMAMAWRGRKAIASKGEWWTSSHTVHSARAEGPFVGATGFSIKFRIDSEEKDSGKRRDMEEIGVYTIQNGKVIREEFMYGPTRTISEGRSRSVGVVETSGELSPELELAATGA